MVMDLTLEQGLRILLQLLRSESKRIALVFISPPCGTASKARERPIKTSLLFGQKQPEPLRTSGKPDQKDMLSGLDKAKTELANQLYEAVTAIVLDCDKIGLKTQGTVCIGTQALQEGTYKQSRPFGSIFITVRMGDNATS